MIEIPFIVLIFVNILVILYKIGNKYNKIYLSKNKCMYCNSFMMINKSHICDACYEYDYLRYYNS